MFFVSKKRFEKEKEKNLTLWWETREQKDLLKIVTGYLYRISETDRISNAKLLAKSCLKEMYKKNVWDS